MWLEGSDLTSSAPNQIEENRQDQEPVFMSFRMAPNRNDGHDRIPEERDGRNPGEREN